MASPSRRLSNAGGAGNGTLIVHAIQAAGIAEVPRAFARSSGFPALLSQVQGL